MNLNFFLWRVPWSFYGPEMKFANSQKPKIAKKIYLISCTHAVPITIHTSIPFPFFFTFFISLPFFSFVLFNFLLLVDFFAVGRLREVFFVLNHLMKFWFVTHTNRFFGEFCPYGSFDRLWIFLQIWSWNFEMTQILELTNEVFLTPVSGKHAFLYRWRVTIFKEG